MSRRSRQVVVDAAYDSDEKLAAIGIGYPDHPYAIIRTNTVPAASSAEAEAKAIIAGLDHLAECDHRPGARVLNDSRDVVRLLNGECPNRHGVDRTTIMVARVKMAAFGYEVVAANRSRTKSAHRGARMSLKAWQAGRQAGSRVDQILSRSNP